jgi:mannosyltransferase
MGATAAMKNLFARISAATSLRISPTTYFLVAAWLILIAFAVRVHLLGAQSLWHDEGNSYVQATRSFTDIATNAALDIHPPGYYWLLASWRVLTGESEFALRLFSALTSTLTIAFAFALGKRLYGMFAGVTVAVVVALNTFNIYYAQETRMYALLGLWSAAGMWAFVNFFLHHHNPEELESISEKPHQSLRSPVMYWGAALALINAAGLWTHYAYPFVMLAQGVMALAWFGMKFWRASRDVQLNVIMRTLGYYVVLNVATIVLFVPWLPTAFDRLLTWPNTGEIIPTEQALNMIFGWLSFGVTYQVSGATFGIVVFLLLFGLLTTQNTDLTAKTPRTQRENQEGSWKVLLPVVWVIVPVGIFMARGLFREANLKLLLPAQIGLALWIARGIWVLWEGKITRIRAQHVAPLQTRLLIMRFAGGLALLWLNVNLFAGLNPLYSDAEFQRDNYRAIVAAISADTRGGDAIILDAPNQREVFDYYYRGAADVYELPQGLGGDDDATFAAVMDIIANHNRVFAVFWGETERDPQRVVESTLSAQTFKASDEWYGDVRLVRYVMAADEYSIDVEANIQFGENITLQSYALNADRFVAGDVVQVQLRWSTDAPINERFVVTVQLLNPDGMLVTQHDGEPGGGLALTTTWETGETVIDNHALLLPNDLAEAHYTLIIGLYDANNPSARLPVGDSDSAELHSINVGG